MEPATFGTEAAADAFGINRLSRPLGYGNAMSAWAGMTAAALGLGFGAHARKPRRPGRCHGRDPGGCATGYLTYSRASVGGTVLGPHRVRMGVDVDDEHPRAHDLVQPRARDLERRPDAAQRDPGLLPRVARRDDRAVLVHRDGAGDLDPVAAPHRAAVAVRHLPRRTGEVPHDPHQLESAPARMKMPM